MNKKFASKTNTIKQTPQKDRKTPRKKKSDPLKRLDENLAEKLKIWAEGGTINEADALAIAKKDYRRILLAIPLKERYTALQRVFVSKNIQADMSFNANKIADLAERICTQMESNEAIATEYKKPIEKRSLLVKYTRLATDWVRYSQDAIKNALLIEEGAYLERLCVHLFAGIPLHFQGLIPVGKLLERTFYTKEKRDFQVYIQGQRFFKASDCALALRLCYWQSKRANLKNVINNNENEIVRYKIDTKSIRRIDNFCRSFECAFPSYETFYYILRFANMHHHQIFSNKKKILTFS